MKYMGSKNRHAKAILAAMRPDINKAAVFIEPFCGGCNITDKLPTTPRIAADINPYLIALWVEVSKGWLPAKVYTEADYTAMRVNPKNYPPHEVGYVSFALSYGGKEWGGWRRDRLGKRNYVQEAQKNAEKQFPRLQGVTFLCTDYRMLDIPQNSVVYCDPPYENTTQYSTKFNHTHFWQWAASLPGKVFVSSYTARPGWKRVWSKQVSSSLTEDTGGKLATEALWVLEGR